MASAIGSIFATKVPLYTYSVPVTEKPEGETAIMRHPNQKDGLHNRGYILEDGRELRTLYEAFCNTAAQFPERDCIGRRYPKGGNTEFYGPFEFINWAQTRQLVEDFAKGLEALNLCPVADPEDKIIPRKMGFYCRNRMEFFIGQMACFKFNITVVPLYDTLGNDTIEYVVSQTNMTTLLASTNNFHLLENMDVTKVPTLKNIIELEEDGVPLRRNCSVFNVYTMEDVYEAAPRMDGVPSRIPRSTGDTMAFLCYTSGTTGMPKGVLLAHVGMMAHVYALYLRTKMFDEEPPWERERYHLSYLPMAHIYEQSNLAHHISNSTAVGFYRGDPLGLLEDIQLLRPHMLPSVPRIWNRLYDSVMAQINAKGGMTKFLFDRAFAAKRYWLQYGYYEHSFWDPLVFKPIARQLGLDRIEYSSTGAAPLAPHVLEFFRCVTSAPMIEGYGQTETSAGGTVTVKTDVHNTGLVGGVSAVMECKLVDIPEMQYLSTDKPYPRGEICFRGVSLFKGYYKMPEKTAETLDADGWIHTGDVGELHPNGGIKIVDRKKNIFKLSQGEYVAAEKIENVLLKSPAMGQAFVYGDSFQPFLVIICVADPETFAPWCKKNGVNPGEPNSPQIHNALLKEFDQIGRANGLKGFEIPRAVYVEMEPWTPVEPEGKCVLTPTMKLRRQPAKSRYQREIDAMYAAHNVAGREIKQESTKLPKSKL
eukprot:Clim_evm1s161 gene=Clim_evmTU1s161